MSAEKMTALSQGANGLTLVDCDVHPRYDEEAIVEYLPPNYREQQGFYIPRGMWTNPSKGFLDVPIPVDGGNSSVEPEDVQQHALDDAGADYVVLNPDGVLLLSVSPQAGYATALAKAYNEWFIDEWLGHDDRFIGSMIVAPQRPLEAAKEIRRIGDHPQIRQVIMASATETPLGRPSYWPIYEAALEYDLPVALHPGSEGHGIAPPPTGAGYLRTFFEKRSAAVDHFIGQLVSVVSEGVFVEYPDLDFVFLEGGFTWLPTLMWRADKDWKSLRAEVPYLTKPPSEYIIENCWFSTHPIPGPAPFEYIEQVLDMMPAEEMLLYGSSYPYSVEGSNGHDLSQLEEPMRTQILSGNAQQLYDLPADPTAD